MCQGQECHPAIISFANFTVICCFKLPRFQTLFSHVLPRTFQIKVVPCAEPASPSPGDVVWAPRPRAAVLGVLLVLLALGQCLRCLSNRAATAAATAAVLWCCHLVT